VRLAKVPVICLAPQYVSEELLRAEGFTDIRYLDIPVLDEWPAIGRGEVNFSTTEINWLITHLDAGVPLVTLAGVHVGCYELFARQGIHHVGELKGKRVSAVENPMLFSLIAAQLVSTPLPTSIAPATATPRSTRWNSLRRARSTPIWLSPRIRRNCARGASETSS